MSQPTKKLQNLSRLLSAVTLAGFVFIVIGWLIVLYEPFFLPAAGIGGGEDAIPLASSDAAIIGQNAILTGIWFALFGAMHGVTRLMLRIAEPQAALAPNQPAPPQQRMNQPRIVEMPVRSAPRLRPQASRNGNVVARGALNGRDYVLFCDGSVVVETLGGPKRFGSMADAQSYLMAS